MAIIAVILFGRSPITEFWKEKIDGNKKNDEPPRPEGRGIRPHCE
jgi:hypothetical protein